MTNSEKSREILQKFVFLNKFEKGKILRKILICLAFFLNKPVKGTNIKFFFSLQSEPHTIKLCFSLVLKHFGEIHRELSFLDKKVALRNEH